MVRCFALSFWLVSGDDLLFMLCLLFTRGFLARVFFGGTWSLPVKNDCKILALSPLYCLNDDSHSYPMTAWIRPQMFVDDDSNFLTRVVE